MVVLKECRITVRYGYFNEESKEYVITRPDTPTPWINYLGNGGFGGIISNNAGGLLFDGDPGTRRLTRYRYNNLPMDRPGRYLYIKDISTGEFWSPTWQPVMKKLDFYECRHGLSYTVIKSLYEGIEVEIKYYVPEGKKYEIQSYTIKNTSNEKAELKLFPYMEFAFYNAQIDNMCEWSRYQLNADIDDGIIVLNAESRQFNKESFYGFMCTSLKYESFECARDNFIGLYRSEQNPKAVEDGCCSNSSVCADNACAAFECNLNLNSGEEKRFIVAAGMVEGYENIKAIAAEALDISNADSALEDIRKNWRKYLDYCQIDTPDDDMNKMINIWHAYQCRTTYNWSRYVSYYERGSDRGWGFRDSMQDVLGVMHAIPQEAKKRIKTLLKIQCKNGNAKNTYYPGSDTATGGGRSDDHLWAVFSVCSYIKETGDYEFLKEIIPYYDGGEGSVAEHLLKGLEFTENNIGIHGIPKFLLSDWNDSISAIGRDGKAESTFVFFQAAAAADELNKLFKHIGDTKNEAYVRDYYNRCIKKCSQLWDGNWFIRAYTGDGEKFGTDNDEYNKIFLNPQSWAVISGLASKSEGDTAFDNVYKYLFTKFGCISHYPASCGFAPERKSYFGLHNGVKENGGVFCHANTWAVIAEAMLKRNDEAFSIYKATIPCARNEIAEQALIEPYVYASAILGPSHSKFGAGSNSWLTGTASWMYYAATQYILGFRPEYDGISIDPCIPNGWNGFKMRRIYRGTVCNLTVKCKSENITEVKKLIIDGVEKKGNFIESDIIKNKREVNIVALC